MNKNNSMSTLSEHNTLQEAILDNIHLKISDAVSESENVSKEKYEIKMKLIESATDMSTQEKFDAMDKNYDRRKQEQQQNILPFAIISFSLLGLAIMNQLSRQNHKDFIMI